jgi:membrane protein DedA with SNARE-associated domain
MELATLGLLGYGLLVLVIVADSVFPVVPSEAAILTAAAATASGAMWLPAVIATIAASALAGDVLVHLLGRYAGQRWTHRLRRRRGWNTATDLVRRRGSGGVLLGRFVPLGRTVVAFTTGAAGMPWRRYLPVAATGAVTWAVVMTLLGRTASTVSTNPLVTIAIGMAALSMVSVVATVAARRRVPLRSVGAASDRQQVLAERRVGHEPLHRPAQRHDDLVVAA